MPKLVEKLAVQIEMVLPGHEMPGTIKDLLAVNVKPVRYRGRNGNRSISFLHFER